MTASDIFDKKLPEVLAKNPTKAQAIGGTFAFIVGPDAWYLDLGAKPSCKKVRSPAQLTVEVDAATFEKVVTNPAGALQLYFQGKVKLTGDFRLATKLQSLFALLAV